MFQLVNVSPPVKGRIVLPLGLLYLAKSLEKNDIPFDIIDLAVVDPAKREAYFVDKIKNINNGVFGFKLLIGNHCMEECIRYAEIVKGISKNNCVVFGGPLATSIPELILQKSPCDYIVLGEGEERLPRLLKYISGNGSLSNLNGIIQRDNAVQKRYEKKIQKVQNLNDYAPPLYDCLDMKFYADFYKKHDFCFDIVASRGCRGNCSFCFKFVGNGFHSRSADSVLDEVAYVQKNWGFTRFAFRDENLLQNKKLYFDLIKKKKKRRIDFKLRCISRVDDLDTEVLSTLSSTDVISIGMGFESMNQNTLNFINKGIKSDRIEGKIQILHKKGIEPRGSFIIGFPDDTEEDFNAIYKFIKTNGLKGTINFLTPLPSTELYRKMRHQMSVKDDWEYFKALDRAYLFQDLVVNLTSLPDDVLLHHKKKLTDLFSETEQVQANYKSLVKT